MQNTVAAVIPALNESASIAAVVHGVRPFATAIVVDDGSSDGTGEIAAREGAIVITHAANRGYEAALSSGIVEAHRRGFVFAVTLDADGQHNPELLRRFVSELEAGCDLVVGRRDRRQRFGEDLFAWVGSLLWRMHDPLCGMKGYRLALLPQHGPFDTFKSVGTEFAVKLVRCGIAHREVFVPTQPRIGQPRFGAGLRANLRIVAALAKLSFKGH